uniref:Putative secreted protein n=1 Tax=Anopheles darlingi TaxID=43151 RepID=A0A2M4D5W1_ANODA
MMHGKVNGRTRTRLCSWLFCLPLWLAPAPATSNRSITITRCRTVHRPSMPPTTRPHRPSATARSPVTIHRRWPSPRRWPMLSQRYTMPLPRPSTRPSLTLSQRCTMPLPLP